MSVTGDGELALDITHRVVSEITHQPAAETRQAGAGRSFEFTQQTFNFLERIIA